MEVSKTVALFVLVASTLTGKFHYTCCVPGSMTYVYNMHARECVSAKHDIVMPSIQMLPCCMFLPHHIYHALAELLNLNEWGCTTNEQDIDMHRCVLTHKTELSAMQCS